MREENPKSESRNPKQIRMAENSKHGTDGALALLAYSNFGFVSDLERFCRSS